MSYLRAWRLSVGQPLVALTRGSFKRKDKSPKGTKADKGRSAGDDRRFTQQALLMKRDKPPRRSPVRRPTRRIASRESISIQRALR